MCVCETSHVPRRGSKGEANQQEGRGRAAVSLKQLAALLNLSPTTLSLVLNNSAGSEAIPQDTKNRIFEAARALNYRPNFVAKSLRSQRTYSVGVLVPELSDGYSALVLTGIEDYLLSAGYMYLVASHRHVSKLIDEYPRLLYDRCVEGIIAVDTPYDQTLSLPVVSVSGLKQVSGVTNITLNHERAAVLGLEHLVSRGHRKIAFLKGQSFSSDTETRWQAMMKAASAMGVAPSPSLQVQMEGESPSPQVGYEATRKLLRNGEAFTALFAFNDVSAIGAIRAFRELGKSVPDDISVMGFDDIYEAAYHIPALTTIRQPLKKMGMLAAQTVVQRITGEIDDSVGMLQVEPELVLRESTAAARASTKSRKSASTTG
jgi:LacI family transcriptional regulator